MTLDIYRIAKEKSLLALVWLEENTLYLKDSSGVQTVSNNTNEAGLNIWLKVYCSEKNAKNIGKISIPKEDIEEFFQSVNEKNPKRKEKIKI